ncbi:MAG: MauE/DoxX family redox-associated membrane protein [Actinomycetota bacterium]
MSLALRLIAAGLAVVFVVAAGAKALDRRAAVEEFASLRLRRPEVLVPLVIATELAVAIALLTVPPLGAMAAFALLAAFTVVLVGVLRSGREVACRCFGSLSSRPISRSTVGRNAVLAALAAVVALA